MSSPKKILKSYWNFNSFRDPQEEIIAAVLDKKDVVALLPTGAGKSICFQVPALILDGICLVISPLIALMQDQVEGLQDKNIKATTITSGSSQDEIITLFDTLKFGNYKFLYISPERLQSNFIQQKIKELNICFIAVDEAHCISEWGHDFRPAYRNIANLKTLLPNINFIALTATANKRVLEDIATNLNLQSPKYFKKSFYRENLAYQVFTVEDKLLRLKQIFTKTKTPAIVYVNSRKKTIEISNFLNAHHFKSTFYHGGLDAKLKKNNFDDWMSEKQKIMIATNAFGMGIDKPNVGVVVHFNIPNSIENYMQESGRAGRNKKKSFAVLLHNENDVFIAQQQLENNLPSIINIKEIHKKLYQYFRIAYGELIEDPFQFELSDFCRIYQFSEKKVYATLQILANLGIIEINNTYNQKSTIIFNASSKTVISYQSKNSDFKKFINSLLRTYAGVFNQKIAINEYLLAKKNDMTSSTVIGFLKQLNEDQILSYQKVTTDIEIRFLVNREDDKTINRFSKEIQQFTKQKEDKLKDLLQFLQNNKVCRSIQLLAYFDEISSQKCGICDVCLTDKKANNTDISKDILSILNEHQRLTSQEINQHLKHHEKHILIHLQHLLSEDKIEVDFLNKYRLKKS